MRDKLLRRDNIEYWISLIGVLAFYFSGLGKSLAGTNATYAIEHINQYNKELFANSIMIGDVISPRFFMNFIVSILMRINGGNWIAACMLLIYISFFLIAFATVEIVFNLFENNRFFLVAVFALLTRFEINTGFPQWSTFQPYFLGVGMAVPVVLIAFSKVCGKKKDWNAAWCILGVATLIHIHEGIYGFCLLFILYLIDSFENRKKIFDKRLLLFVVFFVALLTCGLPSFIFNNSNINPTDFFNIYVYWRSPHNFVPSCWGKGTVIKYFLCIVCGAALRLVTLFICKKEKIKVFLFEAILVISTWLICFGCVYIFTEIKPWMLVIELFLVKYFKYMALLSQIWCIENISDWIEKKQIIPVSIIIAVVFGGNSLGWVRLSVLYLCGIILIYIVCNNSYLTIFNTKLCDGLNIVVTKCLKKNMLIIVCLCALLLATYDRLWVVDTVNQKISWVKAERYIEYTIGKEMYDIAEMFRDKTDVNDVFVADSFDYVSYMSQIVSLRSEYANYKNIPSSINNLVEWYNRTLETQDLYNKSFQEIEKIMRDNNIQYILVPQSYFEKFDGNSDYEIFCESEELTYRYYTLL